MARPPYGLDDLLRDTRQINEALLQLGGVTLIPGLPHLEAISDVVAIIGRELQARLAEEERQARVASGAQLDIEHVDTPNTEAVNDGQL